jgi:hypothetical protein
MKITRKQLRRLIAEAFKQKVPLFDPVSPEDIDTIRLAQRKQSNLQKPHPDYKSGGKFEDQYNPYDPSHHISLDQQDIAKLRKYELGGNPGDADHARKLFRDLGSEEFDVREEQEQAFLDAQDDFFVGLQDYNIEQALEDVFINGNRDPKLLKQLGFTRFGDLDPNYKQSMMKSYSWYYGHIETILNKPIDDLMYVESVSYNSSRFFYSIKHFLDNHFKSYPAQKGLLKVYNKKAKITDVVAAQSFAVGVMIGGNDIIFI